MGLFSSNKSSTANTTNYAITDNSANAAEQGFAVGAGASVSILNTDAEIAESLKETALGALSANQTTALGALETFGQVNRDSLDTTANVATAAINQVGSLAAISARERQDVLNTTTTALQSQQGLASKVADLTSAALERSQTPDSAVTKQLLWVVGAVAALALLILFRRRQ